MLDNTHSVILWFNAVPFLVRPQSEVLTGTKMTVDLFEMGNKWFVERTVRRHRGKPAS